LPDRAAHDGIKQIAMHFCPNRHSAKELSMESYVVRIYRRSSDWAEVVGVVQRIEKNTRQHFHSLNELMQLIQGDVLAVPEAAATNSGEATPR
jgi:hypothetical protein